MPRLLPLLFLLLSVSTTHALELFYFQTGPTAGSPPTNYVFTTTFTPSFLCTHLTIPSSTTVSSSFLTNCGVLGDELITGSGAPQEFFKRYCCEPGVFCGLRGRGMPGCCKRGERCEEVREGVGGEVERWVEGGMLGVRVTEDEEEQGEENAGARTDVEWGAVVAAVVFSSGMAGIIK